MLKNNVSKETFDFKPFYKNIIEGFSEPVLVVKDFKVVIYNTIFKNRFEIQSDKFDKKNILEWFYKQPNSKSLVIDFFESNKEEKEVPLTIDTIEYYIKLKKIEINKEIYVQAVFRSISDYVLKNPNQIFQKLHYKNSQINAILNSLTETIIWTMDADLNFVLVNKRFKQLCESFFNFSPNPGDNFIELFTPYVRNKNFHNLINPFRDALAGKVVKVEDVLNDTFGNEFWALVHVNPIVLNNEINEISCIGQIVTAQKKLELDLKNNIKEKEILLQEIHHRVKNNLQVISSLFNIQSKKIDNPTFKEKLKEGRNRIQSMAYIHESLYQSNNFNDIDFKTYLNNLCQNLFYSYNINSSKVNLVLEISDIALPIDEAIPCGLILNELISNSLKYAFQNKKNGEVKIVIKENKKGEIFVEISDNGIGFDINHGFKNTSSLGLYLVRTLLEQLEAKLDLNSNNGTKYLFTFTPKTRLSHV